MIEGQFGARKLEEWEKENLTPAERLIRAINRRIEDLQERTTLTRGEEIEIKKLLDKKWSEW